MAFLTVSLSACGMGGGSSDSNGGFVRSGACSNSILMGQWDISAFPTGGAVLSFGGDCVFAEGNSGSCPGTVTYNNVTASTGSVTLTCTVNNNTETCTYDRTVAGKLTFDCDGDGGTEYDLLN